MLGVPPAAVIPSEDSPTLLTGSIVLVTDQGILLKGHQGVIAVSEKERTELRIQ